MLSISFDVKCTTKFLSQDALQIHSCILLLIYNSSLRNTAYRVNCMEKEEKKKDVQNETLKPITKVKSILSNISSLTYIC